MKNRLERRRFLHDELFSLTLMATVQRGRLYAPNVNGDRRAEFQKSLRQQLERLAKQYGGSVSESAHLRNIECLSARLSESHSSILREGRFRVGSAQKALNLFLKYLWCMGEIRIPPHCPFDRGVIQRLPPRVRRNWTEIERLDQYKALVEAAKRIAAPSSLAEWELALYNRSKDRSASAGDAQTLS
jgi:hypothetical protein